MLHYRVSINGLKSLVSDKIYLKERFLCPVAVNLKSLQPVADAIQILQKFQINCIILNIVAHLVYTIPILNIIIRINSMKVLRVAVDILPKCSHTKCNTYGTIYLN